MLKVKKNSWHYRLWKLGRDGSSTPHNLCKYFWHLAIIKIAIPIVLATFVLLGVGALLWVIWGHPVQTGIALLLTVVAVLLLFGLIKLIERMAQRHQEKVMNREPKPKVVKEPGVMRSFLKARKQKMCPLIQVIDD